MSSMDSPPPLPPRPAHLLTPSRLSYLGTTSRPTPEPRPRPTSSYVTLGDAPPSPYTYLYANSIAEDSATRTPPIPAPRTSVPQSIPPTLLRHQRLTTPTGCNVDDGYNRDDDLYAECMGQDSPNTGGAGPARPATNPFMAVVSPEVKGVDDLPTTSKDLLIGSWDIVDTESMTSDPCSWLAEEPLYQFTSGYEAVPKKGNYPNIEVEEDIYMDVQPGIYQPLPLTSHKTPWCGVHKVLSSNIIGRMSKQEIAIQEAKFEILTTETSFLKSLNTLKTHFVNSRELTNETILKREDHTQIFSLLKPIQKCSKAFLRDLDKCWNKSIFLPGIFIVVSNHAKDNFHYFVTYCAALNDIKEKLKRLRLENSKFANALTALENSDRCSRLSLDSFLSIPMKRIVGLNLLLKTARAVMLQNYESNKTPEFERELGSCLLALDSIQQVCQRSDQESQTTNRIRRMFELSAKLEYPDNIAQVPIISPHRWLVMHGDVKLHGRNEMENTKKLLTKKKSLSKILKTNKVLRLFLLNDLLLLTKVSSGGEYKVTDYCSMANIQVSAPSIFMSSNTDMILDKKNEYKILLILQENHENKRVEMVLSCPVETERNIWVKALGQTPSPNQGSLTTRRMVCVFPFHTTEPGQISLMKGDEVKVIKTLDNGWLEGVRTRGYMSGSFPPSRVEDASSVFPLVEIFT